MYGTLSLLLNKSARNAFGLEQVILYLLVAAHEHAALKLRLTWLVGHPDVAADAVLFKLSLEGLEPILKDINLWVAEQWVNRSIQFSVE